MRKLFFILLSIILCMVLLFAGLHMREHRGMPDESQITTSDSLYEEPSAQLTVTRSNDLLIYTANSAKITFRTQRPSKKDTTILLSVAAAFTGTHNRGVCGNHVVSGEFSQGYVDIKANSGYCFITTEEIIIKKSDDSLAFYVNKAKELNGCLFQQSLLAYQGKPFPCNLFKVAVYMRALAISDNKISVIETTTPTTFSQFSDAMCQAGVNEAIYLDMGGWDEGWWRNDIGDVIVIGQNRSSTKLQTNWLVFESPQ